MAAANSGSVGRGKWFVATPRVVKFRSDVAAVTAEKVVRMSQEKAKAPTPSNNLPGQH